MRYDIVIANPPYGKIGNEITKAVVDNIDYGTFVNLLPGLRCFEISIKYMRNHIERISGYPNYAIVTGNPYDCRIYVRKNNTWVRVTTNEERPKMTLTKDKLCKKLSIYGWIYRQYYGEIPPNYDIHHINGDHEYNDISNLKLLTKSEHSALHGKTRNSKRVLQKKNGKIVASYNSSREAGRQSGIPQRYISEYINGKRDYAGGYEWEYIV